MIVLWRTGHAAVIPTVPVSSLIAFMVFVDHGTVCLPSGGTVVSWEL